MVKPSKVNKAQAIRELLKQNPQANTKDIIAALATREVKVQPGQVYMVKGRLAQIRSDKRRKEVRVAQAGQKTGSTDPVALILRIKDLARDAGGMDNLKALVNVLAE